MTQTHPQPSSAFIQAEIKRAADEHKSAAFHRCARDAGMHLRQNGVADFTYHADPKEFPKAEKDVQALNAHPERIDFTGYNRVMQMVRQGADKTEIAKLTPEERGLFVVQSTMNKQATALESCLEKSKIELGMFPEGNMCVAPNTPVNNKASGDCRFFVR